MCTCHLCKLWVVGRCISIKVSKYVKLVTSSYLEHNNMMAFTRNVSIKLYEFYVIFIRYCEMDHCNTFSNVMALNLWSFKMILFVLLFFFLYVEIQASWLDWTFDKNSNFEKREQILKIIKLQMVEIPSFIVALTALVCFKFDWCNKVIFISV